MSDAELALWAVILAPLVVLGIVAMVRGYHFKFKLYRGQKREGRDDG